MAFILVPIFCVFWIETLHRWVSSQTLLNVDVLPTKESLKDGG